MGKGLILTTLIVLSIVSSFAIIPGLDKTSFGGDFVYIPLLEAQGFGLDLRYQEGLELYKIDKIGEVYGFFGIGGGYSSVDGSFNFGIPITFIGLPSDYSIKLFGAKLIPAITVDSFIGYDTKDGLKTSFADIYVSLFSKLEDKNQYLNIYFWPFPIIIGFNFMQF
jgi:hypothetical protein